VAVVVAVQRWQRSDGGGSAAIAFAAAKNIIVVELKMRIFGLCA
jgi:hypothetical protein